MKQSVLFVCVHNSARSQMAEAFLRDIADDRFDVTSAGREPGKRNPLAVEAMRKARALGLRRPLGAYGRPCGEPRRDARHP